MSDELCSLHSALRSFADASATQSQEHIKPLHWHIAERLVLEGGFATEDITPRPPLRVESTGTGRERRYRLIYDPAVAQSGEQIVLGGLKTKLVDVVVSNREIGPCLAVSVKGSLNAFRNLTNRMEEAAGDCTNLHLVYPAMVYGFLHILKANREQDVESRNDIAVHAPGAISPGITRYHEAMARLSGRRDVRDDVSRYESVAIIFAGTRQSGLGDVLPLFPPSSSPLAVDRFFPKLYEIYDLRFVYSAPALEGRTRRLEWASDSPVLDLAKQAGFHPRVGEVG